MNELLIGIGAVLPPEASLLAQAIVPVPCPRPTLAVRTLYAAGIARSLREPGSPWSCVRGPSSRRST